MTVGLAFGFRVREITETLLQIFCRLINALSREASGAAGGGVVNGRRGGKAGSGVGASGGIPQHAQHEAAGGAAKFAAAPHAGSFGGGDILDRMEAGRLGCGAAGGSSPQVSAPSSGGAGGLQVRCVC